MRGQLPIVIALTLLLAILIATLYYVTANTTVINQNYYGYTLKEWVLINEELDTLLFLALKQGSKPASQVFNRTFWSTYREVYESYYDGDYYYDFDSSLSNFVNSLAIASKRATWILGNKSISIIENWVEWKKQTGYIVKLALFDSYYNVTIGMVDSTSKTYGLGRVGLKMVIDIVNPIGEYRRFIKSIEAGYRMELLIGHPYGDAIHIPIFINTYIVLNGVKYYYMVPREHLRLTMISNIFTRLPSLAQYTNGNITTISPIATFYYGNGTSMSMYKQEYTNLWEFANDIIDNLVYPTGSYWPVYHDGVFLWASISSIQIDEITVFSALKIVFKYHHTGGMHYWTLWIGVQGDENAEIAY